jgi:nucleoside-diphosphate-sugar epimerase
MTFNPSSITVLVTGAGGFIAMHCILQLLEQGYRVRGTLRSLSREAGLRKTFAEHVEAGDRLEFVTADLLKDDGWEAAVRGCAHVLHVASPFPPAEPKNEDELIIPAREGALRVLRAAAAAGVKRVVLTSSLAAVLYGYGPGKQHFDEGNWSQVDKPIGAYARSKTLAERAAWDFVKSLKGEHPLELAVINPGLVMGPYLDKTLTTSGEVIYRLMQHKIPGLPHIQWNIVDVRDVAAAHVSAMTIPEAAGQRFCCFSETIWSRAIAQVLYDHFKSRGYRIPTAEFPDLFVRLVALFDKSVALILDSLGKDYSISNERIKRVLHWQPHSLKETVIDMAESMIRQGII